LDKIQVGVAKGKWHTFANAITSTNSKVVYTYNTNGGCAAQPTTWEVSNGEVVSLRIYRDSSSTTWYLYAYVDGAWRSLASTTPNWSNKWARKVAAGWELYAGNSIKPNVTMPGRAILFGLVFQTPIAWDMPWVGNVLPSD